MKFSQRLGLTSIEKPLQIEFIDKELLNRLWNLYRIRILDFLDNKFDGQSNKRYFATFLWHNYFKKDMDEVSYDFTVTIYELKKFFFKTAEWYEVFELIESSIESINKYRDYFDFDSTKFYTDINILLEQEFSAYRFVEGLVVPITNDTEIKEIENARANTKQFTALSGCNNHLTESLKILSDKKTIDYRNSIKESISAIESIAKVISGKSSDTLGSALTSVKDKIGIHSALEKGFKQIYGYTSDADGIRHALMEEPNCDFDDAKYMLVSSSAFINYLIAKANKAGISIK